MGPEARRCREEAVAQRFRPFHCADPEEAEEGSGQESACQGLRGERFDWRMGDGGDISFQKWELVCFMPSSNPSYASLPSPLSFCEAGCITGASSTFLLVFFSWFFSMPLIHYCALIRGRCEGKGGKDRIPSSHNCGRFLTSFVTRMLQTREHSMGGGEEHSLWAWGTLTFSSYDILLF